MICILGVRLRCRPLRGLAFAMATNPKGEEEDDRFPLEACFEAELTVAKAFEEGASDTASETGVAQLALARACKHCGVMLVEESGPAGVVTAVAQRGSVNLQWCNLCENVLMALL